MCPMCLGTATLVLSGGGSVGVALLLAGRTRLRHALRALFRRA
jgi:hypothetical protein